MIDWRNIQVIKRAEYPHHPLSGSVESTAAVDRQRRTGNEGRLRAGEKQDRLCDFQRVRDALHRVPVHSLLKARSHRRINHAGAHAVDANGGGQFGRQSSRQIHDAAFRGGIGRRVWGYWAGAPDLKRY